VLETQLAYWKDHLRAPLPTLSLPTDHARPSAPSFRGHRHEVLLPDTLMQNLQALSTRSGVTLFVTLLAGYATHLHRLTGQDDLLIGTPIANRTRPEIEPLIGFFVNTLALRLDLSGRPSFADLVSRTKHVAFAAYAHQDVPYERIVEEVNPDRASGQALMLEALLSLDNTPQFIARLRE
jgi:non-ribosomal peptide synthetase component F